MRCPHCAGEILDGSRFCGICGRRLAARTIPSGAVAAARPAPAAPVRGAPPGKPRAELIPVSEAAVAPLELPISRGARWARILAVLALDVALAGAGVAMIVSFARDCESARNPAGTTAPAAPDGAAPGSSAAALPEARP